MSKLKCLCGHIIVDQSFDLPYKAQFFSDEDYAASYEKFIAFCTNFIQAREEGRQEEFIADHFGEGYPTNWDISEIIDLMLGGMRAVFGHTMYECEQCGRLWIQPDPEKDHYVCYLPETETRGVLRSRRSEKDEDRNEGKS